MPTFDLDSSIRSLVADAVKASLDPYRDILDRMAALLGEAPARRAPERAAAVPAPAVRGRRRRRGGRARKAARLAQQLSEGQSVRYKQGRGTFDARVLSIDSAKGAVTLERISDGKKVVRPASKVLA